MIRSDRNMTKRFGAARVLVALLVLVSLVLQPAAVVMAGEGDGVTGFSMRLKNKDFDGSNTGGGGGEGSVLITNVSIKTAESPSMQQLNDSILRPTLVFDFGFFARWISLMRQ